MSAELFRLRYIDGAHHGKFERIRYPYRQGVDYETAVRMQAAMPDPELFEIVPEGN